VERLGIADEFRQRRESIAARLSPVARHQAFPGVYARPGDKIKAAIKPAPLRKEIERLKAEIECLKSENIRLAAERAVEVSDKPEPTIAAVMDAFCLQMNAAGFSVGDELWSAIMLKSPRRARVLSHPRHVCMWLVRTLCSSPSFPVIARNFGGRDHTSALYAIKHAPTLLNERPDLLAVATAVLRSFGVVLARLEEAGKP
jgi:hypothetical protein